MTKTAAKSDARPMYREIGTHLFGVGQSVRLKGGFRQSGQLPGLFRVTALLPASEGLPQYRVKSDEERHERVTTQDNLEPAGKSSIAKPVRSSRLRNGKHS